MKATEHRLGNLIYSPIQKEIVTLVAIEQGNRPITLGKMGTSSFSSFDCLERIPLTEEWLLKFGFVFGIKLQDFTKGKYQFVEREILKGYFSENKVFYFLNNTKIKSVHQLQNLYFALTGEELEILREKENIK